MLEAIKLLGALTRGYFRIWDLAGPSRAAGRQEIMRLLTGAKMPKAKCGVAAIEAEFYRQMGPLPGECDAHRENAFQERCQQMIAKATA